jgi:uncharacterized protein (DUF305 family)
MMVIKAMSDQTDVLNTSPVEQPQPTPNWFHPLLLVITFGLLALVGILGFWWGTQRQRLPTEGSAEAGFARDMATHHAQAVNMALLLRDRTEDEEMRQLALDIMLTQQAQIGQMQGWLAVWGLRNASLEPAMTWMGMPTTDRMPGMASAEEINHLRTLTGVEAEVLFLQLMIPHHRAGVIMAQAILERTHRPEVRALAHAIVNSQQNEIDYMNDLLQRRGSQPDPEESDMNHEEMSH